MPEEVQQPTPQPQVTTSQVTNWKKIGLTVLIILVVTGLIGGAYWYYVSNKSSDDSDLTGLVPKVTTRTSTESAKEATKSTEKDKTAGWEVHKNEDIGFSVKLPQSFKVDDLSGTPVIYKGEKLNLPPPNDNYPTAFAVYTRSGTDGRDACFKEVCQNKDDSEVGKTYKIDDVKINNASGVKLTSTRTPLKADYYLGNSDGSKIVRIIVGTFKAPNDKRNEAEMNNDFQILEEVIATFKFL